MIAGIWFPNWPVQRLLRARPDLKRSVAIFDSRRRIVAASVPSLMGLPVAEAEGIRLEPGDPAADRAALEQLAAWCDQFSPTVGIELDSLLLDITGIPFDGEQVAKMLAGRGLDARVAVAETVGAAWARAHYSEPLPVAALRLSAHDVDLLHELGIRHLTELQALPRAGLAARFPRVVARLDQFLGILAEPIQAHRARPEIIVERDLEYPLERHDMVESLLTRAVEQLAAELLSRRQGAIRVEFVLRCQPGEARIVVGLFQPSASSKYLLELLLLQLGSLPGPLVALRAAVLIGAPLEVRQRALFDDHHDRQRQLALLIDRMSSRAPALRAVLVADAQPEHAFRYEPLSGRKRRAPRPPKHTRPIKRPLLVESRPIPLQVIAAGGAPAQFRLHGQQHRATRCWGPERIQTGWWRQGTIRRDYYRVQTERGCYWLFRAAGKWFLHGVFE